MDTTLTLSGAPPEELWRQAMVEFAAHAGLSADSVIAGEAFNCNGTDFRLQYDVDADPHGLVVMFDLGETPGGAAPFVHLQMLAANAARPAALTGYFGIYPGSDHAVFCTRLDLRSTGRPAQLISAIVESNAGMLPAMQAELRAQFKSVTGIDLDQAETNAAG
jgi:hypothetical protein